MFIICDCKPDKSAFAVKDTRDGVIEWYTPSQLEAIVGEGIAIKGYFGNGQFIPIVNVKSGVGYAGYRIDEEPIKTKLLVSSWNYASSYCVNFLVDDVEANLTDKLYRKYGVALAVYNMRYRESNSDGTIRAYLTKLDGSSSEVKTFSEDSLYTCNITVNTILAMNVTSEDIKFAVVCGTDNLTQSDTYRNSKRSLKTLVSIMTLEEVIAKENTFYQVERIDDKLFKIQLPTEVRVFNIDDYARVYGKIYTAQSKIEMSRGRLFGKEADAIMENGTARKLVSKDRVWEIPPHVKAINERALVLEEVTVKRFEDIDFWLTIPNTIEKCATSCLKLGNEGKNFRVRLILNTNSTNTEVLKNVIASFDNEHIDWSYPYIVLDFTSMHRVYMIYASMLVCIDGQTLSSRGTFYYQYREKQGYLFGNIWTCTALPALALLSRDEHAMLIKMLYKDALKGLKFFKNKGIELNKAAMAQYTEEEVVLDRSSHYLHFLALTTWKNYRYAFWFFGEVTDSYINNFGWGSDEEFLELEEFITKFKRRFYTEVNYLYRRILDLSDRYPHAQIVNYHLRDTFNVSRLANFVSRNAQLWKGTEDSWLYDVVQGEAKRIDLTDND